MAFRASAPDETEVVRDGVERLISPFHCAASFRSRPAASRNCSRHARSRAIQALLIPELLPSHRSKRRGPDRGPARPRPTCFRRSDSALAEEDQFEAEPFAPRPSHYPCNTTIQCESLDARSDPGETGSDSRGALRDTLNRSPAGGEPGAGEEKRVLKFQSVFRHPVTMRFPTMVVETQCARFDSIALDCGATLSPSRSRMRRTAS
jgi:hypothetical protein